MATNIFNYDGTLLTTVQDGTVDTTHASIKFPGRGYLNYGEPVNENILWILQNFAAASAPTNPVIGQLWYDTSSQVTKFYNGTAWINNGSIISPTAPTGITIAGTLWYDNANNQLHAWSTSLSAWVLVGPLASSASNDPVNPSLPNYSKLQAAKIYDGSSNHQVWYVIIGGTLLGIFSKDAAFTPSPVLTGFGTIRPGLNLNSTISGIGVSGDNTLFKTTQTNLPAIDVTYDLGSNSYKFSNVYASNFLGTATNANYLNLGGNYIAAQTTSTPSTIVARDASSDIYCNILNGTATSAQYADLAELYRADRSYPAGTLVCLGGSDEITVAVTEGNNDVFGVISTNPAYLMNKKSDTDDRDLPVALAGRVPCKVVGPVRKGQRLMVSGLEGSACAWNESYGLLAIVGRSLVNKTSTGVETIEIFVGKN